MKADITRDSIDELIDRAEQSGGKTQIEVDERTGIALDEVSDGRRIRKVRSGLAAKNCLSSLHQPDQFSETACKMLFDQLEAK